MEAESDPIHVEFRRAVRFRDAGLLLLVVAVGMAGALTAVAVNGFERAVDLLYETGFHRIPEALSARGIPGWLSFVLYPVALGLLVPTLKGLVPAEDRHHSVPLVIVAMNKRDGAIRPLTTLLKTLAAILTLGAGGSLGREGPVALLGGGVGSAVGQLFWFRPQWRNTLVAVGAGAAIATAFHAPITGAFFAMEIILIQFSARAFALVALGAVTAVQVSRALVGAPPFPIPSYTLGSTWEIPLYLALGLVIAPLARVYIKVIYGAEESGNRLKALPAWFKPAAAGALFGAVALLLPRTLGGGYDTITEALAGRLTVGLLLLLLLGKLLTIGLTAGGGWPGGVFTPALFLGSMAGGAFGWAAARLLPGLSLQPGAFAVVGMAAMIAAATHAPLTAIALIFEVTRDYGIALPAMLACGVATVFSQRMSPYSIDTVHLSEHGILLPWQVSDLRSVSVSAVMAREVHTVQESMQLKDVIAVMQQFRHGGYPVVDGAGRLVGMITLRDIREVPLDRRLSTPVSTVMARDLAVITPDQTLADAALIMARRGVGRLPVVDAQDTRRLVGVISRSDVLKSYPQEQARGDGEAFLER